MTFTKESEFEALILALSSQKDGTNQIIKNPTEADWFKNWQTFYLIITEI
jgi:hypothetical protein